MSKPADFLLGVFDFFTILLPGVLAAWLAMQYLPPTAACLIDPGFHGATCADGCAPDLTFRTAAFLLTAYLLGNFAFMAGAKLDPFYDRWRERVKPESDDAAFQAATQVRKVVTPDFVDDHLFSTLKWAKSYIQIVSPGARTEIDRFEATSKFFRGLVVVSGPLALHFLVHDRSVGGLIVSLAFGWASYSRFRDQRWKHTELVYATTAIVHATSSSRATSRNPSPTSGEEESA